MIRVLCLVFALAVPAFLHPGLIMEKKIKEIFDESRRVKRADTPAANQNQCGKVLTTAVPVPLILNGSPTFEGQWPWHVALYQTQKVDNKYICGGTLVSNRHVITAAHCVARRKTGQPVDRNTLTVHLGKHNLKTSYEGVILRLVEKIIIHPEFNVTSYNNNLAILELQEPVSYTNWVQPACLWPESQQDLSNVIGKKGSIVGWGFDESGEPSEDLNEIEMPVVAQETCIRSYSDFFARFTSDRTYCAGRRDGSSACNGDSGGGMVFKNGDSWYLRGLVGLSVAKKNDFKCDPTHYVIFTDIAKFLPWVKQNIGNL